MSRHAKFSPLYSLLLLMSLLTACDDDQQQPTTGQLRIAVENVVGGQLLTLGQLYPMSNGEQITVSKFNYLLSNVKLTRADGTEWVESESYHLVKQADPASRTLVINNVPTGDYTKLTFTIGVDSARNMAGAQTGALAQDNDMYWDWNSGYIYLKIEGTSPQSPTGRFVYHVGGFRRPYDAIRTVSPALPSGSSSFSIRAAAASEITLQAEVQNIFSGRRVMRVAQVNTVMQSDSNAVRLAMNYAAGLFRIVRLRTGE